MVICKLAITDEELNEAFRIRRCVFTNEQGIAEDRVFDNHDSNAIHVIARNDAFIVGTARVLLLSEKQAKIERMAVLASFRRRAIGKHMVQFIEDEMKNRAVKQIILHAQYDVMGFYQACGYAKTGKPFQEVGIKHIAMQKELD